LKFKQLVKGNISNFTDFSKVENIIFAGNNIKNDKINDMIEFDKQIEDLVQNLNIDVMPGVNEPSSI
jgi:hypothetical protein